MSRIPEPEGRISGSGSGRAERKRSSTAANFTIPLQISKKKGRSNMTPNPSQEPKVQVGPADKMPSFDQVRI